MVLNGEQYRRGMVRLSLTGGHTGQGPLLLLLAAVFVIGLLLCFVRSAAGDEVYYLNDALRISECFAEGRWIGDETVGFHGFLFKLPAALLFLITGPSILVATITAIIPAVLAVYLSYLIFFHFFESPKWALAGSFLVFTNVFFLRALATFLRDSSILFALLLFIYLVLKKENKWLTGLALLLVLDAKETVYFSILPGFLCWVVYREFLRDQDNKQPSPGPRFALAAGARLGAALLPSVVFLGLMFTTSIIPLNPVVSKILGLHPGGLDAVAKNLFDPHRTGGETGGNQSIFQLARFDNYGWTATWKGKVQLRDEVLGKSKMPVVLLIKPAEKPPPPSKGHHHICSQLEPMECRKGDVFIFSTWYKTASPGARDLHAVIWLYQTKRYAGNRILKLEKDGKWHYIKQEIQVTENGAIMPQFRWPAGTGMTLYTAGTTIEKKNTTPREQAMQFFNPAPASGFFMFFQDPPETSSGWWMSTWEAIKSVINFLLLYLGKLLNPRTFSFSSMPRFFIVPGLVMSFYLFARWKRDREYKKLLIPMVSWFYLLLYWFRGGVGRNILPLAAIIVLFFLFFLKEGIKIKIPARNTLIAATLFTTAALFFEINYPPIKILLAVLFNGWLWLLYYLHHSKKKTQRFLPHLKTGFILTVGLLSFLTFIATSYATPYQLGRWLAWGANNEADQIARHFKRGENIWINAEQPLIQFYRRDRAYSRLAEKQRVWQLKKYIPKAAILKNQPTLHTYSFTWKTPAGLQSKLTKHNIKKITLLISTHPNPKYQFPNQNKLPILQSLPFLKLEARVQLKNKILFIFSHRRTQT